MTKSKFLSRYLLNSDRALKVISLTVYNSFCITIYSRLFFCQFLFFPFLRIWSWPYLWYCPAGIMSAGVLLPLQISVRFVNSRLLLKILTYYLWSVICIVSINEIKQFLPGKCCTAVLKWSAYGSEIILWGISSASSRPDVWYYMCTYY